VQSSGEIGPGAFGLQYAADFEAGGALVEAEDSHERLLSLISIRRFVSHIFSVLRMLSGVLPLDARVVGGLKCHLRHQTLAIE
jgi:hypothetical protein